MSRLRSHFAVIALLGYCSSGLADKDYLPRPAPSEVGKELAFVACPLVRDTEHPCWLAEYEGTLYYLGPQGGSSSPFIAPQLNHKALIEGRIAASPPICGGVVLEDVVASVLPEVDRSCNSILPAEGYPSPPTIERGPAPTHRDNTIVRRRPPIEAPQPPFDERAFVVQFTFDVDEAFIGNPFHTGVRPIQEAVRYALASEARRVRVIGQRAQVKLSNGEWLRERADIGERRARYVAETMTRLGVEQRAISVEWSESPVGNRREDRAVRIVVTP